MKSISKLGKASLAVSIIGAINWGLVGSMNHDLIALVLGHGTHLAKGAYILVGVCGLYSAYNLFFGCSACHKAS